MQKLWLLALVTVAGSLTTACNPLGPPAPPATATPPPATATLVGAAQAFLSAWEARSSAQMLALTAPDYRAGWGSGGPAGWLTSKSNAYGAPIPGQGTVAATKTAGPDSGTADLVAIYDCKNAHCSKDKYAYKMHITLARQADGQWLITNEADGS